MFCLETCLRPEIAKGGNLGERLQRIAAKCSRGRSERAGTETGPGAEAGAGSSSARGESYGSTCSSRWMKSSYGIACQLSAVTAPSAREITETLWAVSASGAW